MDDDGRPFRIRRSSSSLISSSTSPFPPPQTPPQPQQQQQIQQQNASPLAHHSRNHRNIIDDETISSSNSNFPPPPSPRHHRSSINNYGRMGINNPPSPMGSPDSTYWGAASPISSSYRVGGPATPGGLNVVSSSTVDSSTLDDVVPQSPFSVEESNQNNMLPPVINNSSSNNLSRSLQLSNNSNNHSNNNILIGGNSHHQQQQQPSINEIPPSPIISPPTPPILQPPSGSTSNSIQQSPSFSSSTSILIRNKIKKASSFERFSQQALQQSSNSNSNNSNSNTSAIVSSLHPPAIPSEQQSNNRILWDSVMPSTSSMSNDPPLQQQQQQQSTSLNMISEFTITNHNNNTNNNNSLNEGVNRFQENQRQIKIPSKKLAAKIASVFEQAQLNEQLQIASQAAEINNSTNNVNVTTNNHNIIDHSNNSSSIQVNHTILLRELSESPLNLTENVRNNNNVPVISTKTTTSTTISTKKIPLTPKQKLLHRSLMQNDELSQPQIINQSQQQQQNINNLSILQESLQQQQQQHHHQHEQNQHLDHHDNSNSNSSSSADNFVIQSSSNHQDSYSYDLLRTNSSNNNNNSNSNRGDNNDFCVHDGIQMYQDSNDYYNYGNEMRLLPDDFFTTNPGPSNSTNSNIVGSGSVVVQSQHQNNNPPLEFVLAGLNDDRNREDEMHLHADGNRDDLQQQQQQQSSQHQNFIDHESLRSIANESTLRNLLMMEPLRSHDDPLGNYQIADYRSNNNRSSQSQSGSISQNNSAMINVNMSNWINDWPRSSWQNDDEQEDVVDMSVIDPQVEKGIPINMGGVGSGNNNMNMNNNMGKRIHQHIQQGNNHHPVQNDGNIIVEEDEEEDNIVVENIVVSERDLPLLSTSSMSIPMDFNTSSNSGGKNQMDSSTLSIMSSHHNNQIDLQQQQHHHHHHHHHHRLSTEHNDEPVNLMSASINIDTSNLNHSHNNSHSMESPKSTYNNIMNAMNASQQQLQQQQQDFHMDIVNDNIDERRIIRVKKKETVESLTLNQKQSSSINLIPDKPVQRKSFASLPSVLSLIRLSGNGWAVFTAKNSKILPNTRFGPIEGPLKKAYAEDLDNPNAIYPCLLMVDNSNILWHLDFEDDELCNWMKFCRLAKNQKDQNAIVTEDEGLLYFTTIKEIPPKTELQVGYSFEYASKYGLPYIQLTDSPSPQSENVHLNEKDIESFLCFECELDFSSIEQLNEHLEKSHKQTSTDAGKKIVKRKQVKKANNVVSSSSSTSIKSKNKNVCTLCGSNFLSQISLKMHIDEDHDQNRNSFVLKEKKQVVQQQQRTDSSSNSNSNSNSNHEPDHEDFIFEGNDQDVVVVEPNKSKCALCYKSFATKARLEKHMVVHSEESSKPLACTFCTKRFLTNSALAGHLKIHAEEGKNFECPMCEFGTTQLLALKEHVQTHKNKETNCFHCQVCKKKFSLYPMIRKHIRAFHGPKLYSCESCPMSFPTSDKLKLHKLKHSDHREFLCAECGRQFKRKDKLREHTKRMHESKKKLIEHHIGKRSSEKHSKKFTPKVSPDQYEKFLYKCNDCMVGFKRRGMLVNHLAKRHPDKSPSAIQELNLPILRPTKNYYCPHCERVYKSSSKRKSHILKSHPGKLVPPQLRGQKADNNTLERNAKSVKIVESSINDENRIDSSEAMIEGVSKGRGSNNDRRETIVGKVSTTAQPCEWCHRQYATRAKLLQHQRKQHLHLMPPEIQLPRTQKNNVLKMDQSNEMITVSVSNDGTSESIRIIPESALENGPNSPHQHQQQLVVEENSNNIIGFLLTSATLENGTLSNILPAGEILIMNSQNNMNNQQIQNVISNISVNPILNSK